VGRPRLDAVEDVHGAAPGLARGGVGRVPAEHLAMHGPEVDGGHGERRRTSTAGGGAARWMEWCGGSARLCGGGGRFWGGRRLCCGGGRICGGGLAPARVRQVWVGYFSCVILIVGLK
jgi:hypothetical protein